MRSSKSTHTIVRIAQNTVELREPRQKKVHTNQFLEHKGAVPSIDQFVACIMALVVCITRL